MDKKTFIEKKIISLFRERWPEFPKGKLLKTESPDFILKLNRRHTIGIEITRIDPFVKATSENIMITSEQLLSTIRRKEEKLPLYYKHLSDSYWLIIVAGLADEPFAMKIPENSRQWNIQSEFSKVFLFLLPEMKIIELN